MKTRYKYIFFKQGNDETIMKNAGSYYECKNIKSDSMLGYVFYYQQWKQYVFTQSEPEIVFSISCLLDIIDFVKQL